MIHTTKKAITFDDVLILPAYSEILPKNINFQTKLTKQITLNIPILSAAMDTVTESKLAIALAKEGGIGFIHKNMSTKKQIQEIKKVKNYNKKKIIIHPKCISPNTKISEIQTLNLKYKFSSYPIISKNKKLLGIITNKNILRANNPNQKVSAYMTPKNKLITAKKNENFHTIYKKMKQKKINNILVIDKKCRLFGMIDIKNLQKTRHPNACKDKNGKLRVGAAINTQNTQTDIHKLIMAGVDILLIDSAHGHSKDILQMILQIKSKYPNIQIIGGNIATGNAAIDLIKVGADAVKVGIGPGSICTTRIVTGVGVPQLTAISDVSKALQGTNIPIIADGGIRFSGDIAKAIVAGASCVMLGSLLAGSKESPGNIEIYQGRLFKSYRGMGSKSAMSQGSASRYNQQKTSINQLVPEGVEGKIAYKGKLTKILHQQIGGLKSCMRLTGCSTIQELQKKAKFIIISQASMQENHAQNIIIKKY
ncbi:MAG: inosine 5'-monophosphate dehydrogenase [Candidatus Westeberhardia cardiocondylae]|nr:inosine 5'-monophosphate dehydrogenase [Candidatus Westeberhardia cardiocondylae]